MGDLREFIRSQAAELGIDRIGFARAERLNAEAGHFRDWLDRGFHASMAWLERDPDKRTDPKLIFPAAKTVISVAVNYYTPSEHADGTEMGKISRYAWGDDYHSVVKEKLAAIFERIRTLCPEAEGKICVDTSPMMDKGWAVRAGLGWIGKHSNLITTTHGSWVFLGELLIDIEIEPDEPYAEDHCGTCRACIDACPTTAIVEPFVVDSTRCISYATIELRDETLPGDIAADLNGWLYGCDICQDVCPWNRFERPTNETRFLPRHGETSLPVDRISSMTHEEYVERFRGSAMKRAKLSGLQRNAGALICKDAVPEPEDRVK